MEIGSITNPSKSSLFIGNKTSTEVSEKKLFANVILSLVKSWNQIKLENYKETQDILLIAILWN